MERKKYYFLRYTIVVLIIAGILSVTFSISLVLEGIMSIGWAIFFIAYPICLILLDFIWAADKTPKGLLRWRWRPRQRRFYHAWYRRWEEKYRKELAKLEPRDIALLYRDLRQKKMWLIFAFCPYVVIFACWGAIVWEKLVLLLPILGILSCVVCFSLWALFDEERIVNSMKQEKLGKKKRELERFKAVHHN